MTSLYERVGGEAAIMAAADLFYRKVLADDLLKSFFVGLDMEAQVKKQIGFLSWVLGGPIAFRGRDLGEAHADLVKRRGLSNEHFDAVAKHLAASLRELGVAGPDVTEVMITVESLRSKVLGG